MTEVQLPVYDRELLINVKVPEKPASQAHLVAEPTALRGQEPAMQVEDPYVPALKTIAPL